MKNKEKEYVPNKVYGFRISVLDDFTINVPVDPYIAEKYIDYNEKGGKWSDAEEVQRQYFTKERIEELKENFINRFMAIENPFTISCFDVDGDWNYTKDDLFDLK